MLIACLILINGNILLSKDSQETKTDKIDDNDLFEHNLIPN